MYTYIVLDIELYHTSPIPIKIIKFQDLQLNQTVASRLAPGTAIFLNSFHIPMEVSKEAEKIYLSCR